MGPDIDNRKILPLLILLLVIAAALGLWDIGRVPLFEPVEGRNADIALTILKTGDWLIPRANGEIDLSQPPLSNWLTGLSFKLLGPSETSARLPSLLLGLLLLLGMVRLGTFLFDALTGLTGASILLTCTLFLIVFRLASPAMTSAFLVFVSISCFARLLFSKRQPILFFYGAFLAAALAALAQGLIAWTFTLLPAALFAVWEKKKIDVPAVHWIVAGILSAGISLSWYLVTAAYHPAVANHATPFYVTWLFLPAAFFPWIISVPAALGIFSKRQDTTNEDPEKMRFLMLAIAVPLLLAPFSGAGAATCLAPLVPWLALIVAPFWKKLSTQSIPASRPVLIAAWVTAGLYFLLMIGVNVWIHFQPLFFAEIDPFYLLGMKVVLIFASWVLMLAIIRKKIERIFRTQIGIIVAIAVVSLAILPDLRFPQSKTVFRKIMESGNPESPVILYGSNLPGLSFYLGKPILRVGPAPVLGKPWNGSNAAEEAAIIQSYCDGEGEVFVITDQTGYERIQALCQKPVYVLLKQGNLLLLTNRPL